MGQKDLANMFYRDQLSEILNSRSWRFTSPIRKIFAIFSKKKFQSKTTIFGSLNSNDSQFVVIFVHELTRTGAPIATLELGKSLISDNNKILIIALRGGDLEDELEKFDINYLVLNGDNRFIESLPLENIQHLIFSSVETLILYDYFRKYSFNISIWLHELSTTIRLYGLDKVVSLLSSHEKFIFGSFFQKNEIEKEFGILFKKFKIHHIYPEFNLISDTYLPEVTKGKTFKIIFAGTFIQRKGADLFPLIVSAIQKKASDYDLQIDFVWIGDVPDKSLLDQVTLDLKKLGLLKFCHFTRSVDNLDKFLNESDILILPSREDPAPLVAVNYLQFNKPVFAFRQTGGLLEYSGAVNYLHEVDYMDFDNLGTKVVEKMLEINTRRSNNLDNHCEDTGGPTHRSNSVELLTEISSRFEIKENFQYSVVVPVYNHVNYLKQRLDSIDSQTLLPIEILVIDDASRDGSVDFIREYNWNSKIIVKTTFNETNSGSPFSCWNSFSNSVNTEYFWIAEGDDYALPNFIERLSKFTSPLNAIVFCNSTQIDADGNPLHKSNSDHVYSLNNYKWNRTHSDLILSKFPGGFLERNLITNASSAILRKPNYEVKGLSNFKIAGDWFFYTQAFSSDSSYLYLNEKLSFHRTTLSSQRISVSPLEHTFPEIRIVQKNFINRIRDNSDDLINLVCLLRTFIDTCLSQHTLLGDVFLDKFKENIGINELSSLNSLIILISQEEYDDNRVKLQNYFSYLLTTFNVKPFIILMGLELKICEMDSVEFTSFRYHICSKKNQSLLYYFLKNVYLGKVVVSKKISDFEITEELTLFNIDFEKYTMNYGTNFISLLDKNILNFLTTYS
jgi:glycosyltransferase involved in cell wall biosynthesis